jgi:hypothetical protein
MARRALPALLVAAAAAADATGEHQLALYALLAAVPAAAVASLAAFGEVLDGAAAPSRQLQALLGAVGLALILTGAAVRAPAVLDEGVPTPAATALVAALAVFALEAAVGAGRAAVERPPRRVRPALPADELRDAA